MGSVIYNKFILDKIKTRLLIELFEFFGDDDWQEFMYD
jgi:hypothetical protein